MIACNLYLKWIYHWSYVHVNIVKYNFRSLSRSLIKHLPKKQRILSYLCTFPSIRDTAAASNTIANILINTIVTRLHINNPARHVIHKLKSLVQYVYIIVEPRQISSSPLSFFLGWAAGGGERGDPIFVAREALRWARRKKTGPAGTCVANRVYPGVVLDQGPNPSHVSIYCAVRFVCRTFARLLIRVAHQILAPFKDGRYASIMHVHARRRNLKPCVQSRL